MEHQIYLSSLSNELNAAGVAHTTFYASEHSMDRDLVKIDNTEQVVKVAIESTPLDEATYELYEGEVLKGKFEAPKYLVKFKHKFLD